MKSFEVQIHRASRWQTDSTYDDRGLAELRARQIDSNAHADPVRVVEEVFVEKTQKYVLRTIYRDNKFRQSAQAKVDETRQARADTMTAERPSETKAPEKAPGQQRTPPMSKRKSLSAGALFGILILIVGMGIGTMIALEYYLMLS